MFSGNLRRIRSRSDPPSLFQPLPNSTHGPTAIFPDARRPWTLLSSSAKTMVIDFHTHIFPPEFSVDRIRYVDADATFGALYAAPNARMATA